MQKVESSIPGMMQAGALKSSGTLEDKLLAADKLENAMEDIAAEGDTDKDE